MCLDQPRKARKIQLSVYENGYERYKNRESTEKYEIWFRLLIYSFTCFLIFFIDFFLKNVSNLLWPYDCLRIVRSNNR